jgi:hypothetical protein
VVRWLLLRTVAAVIGLTLLRIFVDFEVWPFLVGSMIASVIIVSFTPFRDFQRRKVLAFHEKRWDRIRARDEGPDMRRLPNT